MIHLNFRTTIKRFYPYEVVQLNDRILTFDSKDMFAYFKLVIESILGEDLKCAQSVAVGFSENYCKLAWDNKVTFMMETAENKEFYMQFYDNQVIIGLSLMKRNYDPNTHYLSINEAK